MGNEGVYVSVVRDNDKYNTDLPSITSIELWRGCLTKRDLLRKPLCLLMIRERDELRGLDNYLRGLPAENLNARSAKVERC
jgi:hypothetical protein